MALPDKTDYSKSFYAENVALSLQARREMPWGRTVPEREFKHFVLPVRVIMRIWTIVEKFFMQN